jgi:ergothioneine biosynthesis protein EgtB
MVQAMPDVSPPKWHLGHTTWFFETFVLEPRKIGYESSTPVYRRLFNSYYEAVGQRHPRAERGNLSRPTLSEVLEYREHVDHWMHRALDSAAANEAMLELGLHHEQQHQELLVMDVKFNFSKNPLLPVYRREPLEGCPTVEPLRFRRFEGGLVRVGDEGEGFAFDNERPSHRRFIEPFELATRLITNGEMLEFIQAGGYTTPSLWLSDGWSWLREQAVAAPLYWITDEQGGRFEFTAHGKVPLDPNAPVCHVSGYEALAFATWAGARLATEFEWELAARDEAAEGAAWLGEGLLHPRSAASGSPQFFGNLWQWTRSAYEPYPGFKAFQGAAEEYNGKFMSNQWVLRGGSVASPRGHVRATYRNFFYPEQRWPFTGIRLAREAT